MTTDKSTVDEDTICASSPIKGQACRCRSNVDKGQATVQIYI